VYTGFGTLVRLAKNDLDFQHHNFSGLGVSGEETVERILEMLALIPIPDAGRWVVDA